MKHYYILLVAILVSFTINAQIIDIPDANFKNALVNTNCVDADMNGNYDSDVDTNDDGEIQISEALAVTNALSLVGQSISSLDGIENFVNLNFLLADHNQITSFDSNWVPTGLTYMDLSYNLLTSLEINNAPSLQYLNCEINQLTSLTLGDLPNLRDLYCNANQLSTLDLSGTPGITELHCSNNQLTILDLSNRTVPFSYLQAASNQLTTLILKNGIEDALNHEEPTDFNDFSFSNNPNLTYICADEVDFFKVEIILGNSNITNYTLNSYCSFEPGGEYFTIEGNVNIDINNNGCDINDVVVPNLNFEITNGSETGNFISDTTGDYSIPVGDGTHTITPILENPSFFSVTPSSISVDFPTDVSPFNQDFCITPNGTFNDLEITIIPLEVARPGFDTNYKVIYKNKGTTSLSGDIDFGFEDEVMEFVSSTPPNESGLTDLLSWSFTDLAPFESREIELIMNLNTPMDANPLNGDEVLTYITSISISETDETPNDNTFTLNQTVVNSFDPNDKTCLEGDFITPEMVGEYVHYMIRFENTGTADAINIVVKDDIDTSKYDLSSLVPLHASHNYVARIKDNATDHYVEFIFENINLPFNDANNDGYIVFKIKTLDTLVLNDTFENDAEIYFDFNFPIITNTESTTVGTLSTEEFEFDNSMSLYPNPTTDVLTLESQQAIKQVTIYDMSGRLIKEIAVIGFKTETTFYTKDLSAGTYFVKIKTQSSEVIKQFIKD